MSKSGKKKSLYLGITELQNAVCVFVFNEMDKYIRLDTTCRMFFRTYPETPKKHHETTY